MKHKKIKFVLILSIIITLVLELTAFAVSIPEPTDNFFVNDFANVISNENEKEIMQIGADLYKQTTAQIVVVTIDSLDGEEIRDYALQLGREWGIGDNNKNNGIVILLSVNDRKVDIEIGYGLEGAITDGMSGRILDEYALPYFSDNDFSEGLKETYKAVSSLVYKEYGVEPNIDFNVDEYELQEDKNDLIYIILSVIIIIVLMLIIKNHRGPFIFIGGSPYRGYGGYNGRGSGSSSGGGFSGGGGSFGGGGSSRSF